MKQVVLIEGGIGKQIAMTGVLVEAAKKSEEGIIVISPYDYIFWGLPGIEVYSINHVRLYENVIKPNNFLHLEPYHDPETYRGGRSIVLSAAAALGLPLESRSPADGPFTVDDYRPRIRLSTYEKNEAEEFVSRPDNAGGYIIFQPFGASHGPHGDNTSRSMPVEFAQKLATEMAKKYRVYQVSAPHVPVLEGCVPFSPENSPRQIMAVASKAAKIVTCDSFMNHAAVAVGRQAIVVWGSTSEKIFGYPSNINIREFQCPEFIPTRLYVNDPSLDDRNSYSNQFTEKTLNKILEYI